MSKTYHSSLYPLIDDMEKSHFWFFARNRLIKKLIARHIPHPRHKKFLDVGCGTGALLASHESLGFQTTGMDINKRALVLARDKSHARLIRSSLQTYKGRAIYDAIGLFDILEHQRDDKKFLHSCHKRLKKDGYLFITVPALMRLWSPVDDYSGHCRRYEKKQLVHTVEEAGFRIVFTNYWNMLLMPVNTVWRLIFRYFGKNSAGRFFQTPLFPINMMCRYILLGEEKFFFSGDFPIGSSLVLVAQKL